MLSPRKRIPLRLVPYNHVWTRLADPEDSGRIDHLFSYYVQQWKATTEGKELRFKQKTMISPKGYFLTGFVPMLEERFTIEWDKVKNPRLMRKPRLLKRDLDLIGVQPRYYQTNALTSVIRELRGQVIAPTGTGKTIMASMVLAAAPKARILFVVHTKDLLDQAHTDFRTLLGDNDIGIVGEGVAQWRQRTVGMIQSLRGFNFKKCPLDMILVDEAHHAPAETYETLLRQVHCPIRLGFTATERKDAYGRLRNIGLLGPVIFNYTYQQGVADGYLAQAKVRMLDLGIDLEIAETKMYPKVYDVGVIRNEARNNAIAKWAKRFASEGKTMLIQVTRLDHGHLLKEMLGRKAVFVYGGTNRDQRTKVKTLMKEKKLLMVICSSIWDEGVDIPNLDAIIVAGGGMSEIKAIQKVGRGLRKTATKDSVQVIDFSDLSHKYLRKHSRERVKAYRERGWEVRES